ncbi:hydroxylysine kinase-like [Argopecten irradians]|uniref:hydroxylysine kinase-like n=1 Tax=Argopecten irradians TaxID=31199 RepID=UPI0037164E34
MIVLTYIEGHVLSDLSVTPSVIQELGNLSGKLNIRMQSFSDSGALDYDSIWKLSQIGQLQGLIHYAPSEKLRTLASKIISEFNLLVMTRVQEFQTGLIHHDMGLQNIVMRRNDTNSTWQVAAILDFGDVCTSCYVFEVAILISNMFMNELSRSFTTDKMASTRDMVLESYTSVMPLSATEKSVLDICIVARILQCSLLGEKARESDPGNVYIGNYICWGFLDKLDGETKISIRQDDEEAKTLLIPNNV